MTRSLNSVLPVLARILDEPADTLRTRQRALVAADALDSTPGRGPGSGVAATGKTLAQFLIGSCVGVDAAGTFARTRPARGKCALTGAKTFLDAVATVLSDENLCLRIQEIMVGTSYGHAIVRYDGASWKSGPEAYAVNPSGSTVFGGAAPRTGIRFHAIISGDLLRLIRNEVLS